MKVYYQDDTTTLYHGDCLDVLASMPDNSVDAVVTDPPYGLSNTKPQQVADVVNAWVTGDTEAVPAKQGGFMGKDWDSFVPPPAVWEECLRVLKPGGHMIVFAGTRTHDLMGLSIRLAGFEIRDTLGWVYSQGFPKSMDVSKAIDRSARIYEGRFEDARRWTGWGTGLKPAIEPIILARKPLVGTVANNVLAHGVGGLNIDACRVPSGEVAGGGTVQGRWPANVLLDPHAAAEMDKQSGWSKSRIGKPQRRGRTSGVGWGMSFTGAEHEDEGGASRFFPVFKYQAKPPTRERPIIEREDGTKIQHPTVKPLALMEWLIRLITPPGGTVLDPFAGSGTTIEAAMTGGFAPIGIEMDAEYLRLIDTRITRAKTSAQEVLDLGDTA